MYTKYENKRQTPWDTIDVFEAYCLTPQTFFREIKSRKENKEPNIWTELNRKVIFFTLISIHIKYLLILKFSSQTRLQIALKLFVQEQNWFELSFFKECNQVLIKRVSQEPLPQTHTRSSITNLLQSFWLFND